MQSIKWCHPTAALRECKLSRQGQNLIRGSNLNFRINPDLQISVGSQIAHKMYRIHSLVGVSHFATYCNCHREPRDALCHWIACTVVYKLFYKPMAKVMGNGDFRSPTSANHWTDLNKTWYTELHIAWRPPGMQTLTSIRRRGVGLV